MRRLLGAILLPLLSLACAANPVATASRASPENKAETVAFALHNSYTVVAERLANIVENPATPKEVRQTLIGLHEIASPAAHHLRDVANAYKKVREAYQAGTSSLDKLSKAALALDAALTDAAPKINAVSTEVASQPGGGR